MMPSFRLVSAVSFWALLASAGFSAEPIKHEFLALDEGLGNLLYVNEANPAKNYVVAIGHPLARDMQLEGDGKLLISHDQGYCEYDIATGKKLKDVATFHDVSSARRLENGNLLLAGVDFDGVKLNKGHNEIGDPHGRHVQVVEYSPEGKEVHRTTYLGDYLRLLRQTDVGTYLFALNTHFSEADAKGNYIKDFAVPGFKHAWKALRMPNGHVIMSGGYGAFMAEIDADGKLVRKFGQEGTVAPEIHPNFYALFQVMPNGHIVAANWQGHGPGHGAVGKQVVEFDNDSKVVWTWSDPKVISSIQGVLVLDGLDLSRRYDERTGTMEPIGMK